MSKITFRADDDLVDRLEALDVSKSEAMREALRSYLEGDERSVTRSSRDGETSIDDLVRERVDDLVADRLGRARARPQDVNVNISLEGLDGAVAAEAGDDGTDAGAAATRDAESEERSQSVAATPAGGVERDGVQCGQCGEHVDADHVYCPNCGEKASRRLFCECGDELRSDWSFCPGCGRRTPAADVLERS